MERSIEIFAAITCLAFGLSHALQPRAWVDFFILTFIGWAQVVKGTLILIAPQIGMRSLERVSHERAWGFIPVGVVLVALSGVFWYVAYTR